MTVEQTFESGPGAHPEGHPEHRLSVSRATSLARVAIEDVSPVLDGGAWPVKSLPGRALTVDAKVFTDGHDKLAVMLRWHKVGSDQWHSTPMVELGNDSWRAQVAFDEVARHSFMIEA